MCGLAGIFTRDGSHGRSLEELARPMCRSIVHRGPDDEGSWVDPDAGVALGFRRLAIVDLSNAGHQPMASPSGRFHLVFNGEVYNHREIRVELEQRGFRFRGHSDTEVIVAAFEEWGVDAAVRRFIGMFAIAAWDARTGQLFLVRDRLGIKPLYYYHRPGFFSFGSELKALIAGPEFNFEIDPDALTAYLRYLYVPAPATIYRDVKKLLPGHILTLRDPGSAPAIYPFWSIEEVARQGLDNPFPGSEEDAIDELERLLTSAVRLRMQADVPLGALLSGGVDSSTVVALMQRHAERPTRTFSIGFTTEEHNEAHHAATVARHLETDHTELILDGDSALAVVPDLPRLFDEPLADPSQIPTFLVCRLARREVVVALSGDGGDELFGGYNRYTHGDRIIERLSGVPRRARLLAAAAAGALSASSWNRTYHTVSPILPPSLRHRLPGEKISKLGHLLRGDSGIEMYRSLLSASQRPEELVAAGSGGESRVEAMLRASQRLPALDWMMLTDQATYLADDLLAKVDRASMAVSLEARVPLLDHRVVEFSWSLPRSMKIRDREGKWILRRVLDRYVPRNLVERPKMGFSVPIAEWLRGPLRSWGDDLVSSRGKGDEWLNRERINERWGRFQRGDTELALSLWAVLMFLAWRNHWLE